MSWELARKAQTEYNAAVREASKVFNDTKRETGKEDMETFEASIRPKYEAFDKAYKAAQASGSTVSDGERTDQKVNQK